LPTHRTTPARPKPKPAAATSLVPLPSEQAAAEQTRLQALRAFAQEKADDLRSCVKQPGAGPQRRVGAALEIDARGVVAAVQILGSHDSNRTLETCYAGRLRRWRFPKELLDGDERLLVNFVF
jgi:hypothetical protein